MTKTDSRPAAEKHPPMVPPSDGDAYAVPSGGEGYYRRTARFDMPLVGGVQYSAAVGPLAQSLVLCVTTCGRSKCLPGFRVTRALHRTGGERKNKNRFPLQSGCLLHYVRSGEMLHRLRGATYAVRAGQACLMDLREPSDYWVESGPVELDWILFDGLGAHELCVALRETPEPVIDRLDKNALRKYFLRLFRLMEAKRGYSEPRVWAALTAILGEVLTASGIRTGIEAPRTGPECPQAIRDILIAMAVNHQRDYSIKESASAAGMRPAYFSRVFRRHVGEPPIVWLNRYRIRQAEAILVSTGEPVGRVGELVGIPHRDYFYRVFRAFAGCTPAQYRSRHQRRRQTQA